MRNNNSNKSHRPIATDNMKKSLSNSRRTQRPQNETTPSSPARCGIYVIPTTRTTRKDRPKIRLYSIPAMGRPNALHPQLPNQASYHCKSNSTIQLGSAYRSSAKHGRNLALATTRKPMTESKKSENRC